MNERERKRRGVYRLHRPLIWDRVYVWGLQLHEVHCCVSVLTSMTGLTLNSLNTPPSAKKLFRCQLCHKELCSKASLKRHVADKHAARQEEYRCVICERVYCSRNSLMTHIYTYHKSRPGDIDIKFF
ncbi:Broad-complex core protein isoforms 1/2/3/4/5 [Dufourea novaeangliae]|uniref:Broad-complex core protein isoforms 1/2/3/4/5 n=1 Tax=Dufourea novaeangliae TaxID=178035 RepID=A0A154PSM6_DUFNO|nr:Broad-complex core protein isoforms 1/2/3/4/5 [Dufourea novaeangliae]